MIAGTVVSAYPVTVLPYINFWNFVFPQHLASQFHRKVFGKNSARQATVNIGFENMAGGRTIFRQVRLVFCIKIQGRFCLRARQGHPDGLTFYYKWLLVGELTPQLEIIGIKPGIALLIVSR